MADSSASKRSRSEISGNAATGAIGLPNRIGRSSIFFGSDFADRDVRLIEISEELLKQLDSRDSLKIIGPVEASSSQGATDAVLTSKNKTFSIKKVETSNAVYLVDPSKSETYRIQSASQDYYELKSIPPRIERIKELCAEYDGISEDLNSDTVPPLLSYDELRCQIQASDEEFESSLFKLAIVKLNGKMRCLSKIAIRETIQKLLLTIMEERWDINCINENLCVRNIPDTDPILLNFSLQSLGEKISVSGDKMGQGQGQGQGQEPSIWTLDHNTIARSTAHRLFNSQSDPMMPWECEDFLRTWDLETPGSKIPDESLLLNGIAIKVEIKQHKSISTDGSSSYFSYRYLPFEEMSSNLQVRLGQLFAAYPRYLEHELEPYFVDMVGGIGKPKNVAELLLSHTRVVDDFYISK